MSQEDIQARQQERFNVIKKIYDLSDGNPSRSVTWRGRGNIFNLDDQKTLAIIRYLSQEELVDAITSNSVQITNLGVNEVEDKITNPQNSTEHFSQNVIIIEHMENSAIQQGTVDSNQVLIIEQSKIPEIQTILEKISNSVEKLSLDGSDKDDLAAELETASSQLKVSKPKTVIIKECFKSIKGILEKAASSALAAELIEGLSHISF